MRDVARAAGVSPMTVSNALTGTRPVSDDARRRVAEAVERLGYSVNLAARSLRQGRTGVVGLAVPSLDRAYFGQLAAGLAGRLAREGLRVVVEQTGGAREGELAALRGSRLRAYDGLVISAVGLDAADIAPFAPDVPVVVLGERVHSRPVDHVVLANEEGARAAAALLLERGCRRLAVAGAPPLDAVRRGEHAAGGAFARRAAGVLAAVDAVAGASAVAAPADGGSLAAGAACARALVDGRVPFDGVVCATDTVALGVLRGLADRGVRVPDDALVVGFDDVEEARYSVPSLSSVAPGHDVVVEEAARLLLRRVEDRAAPAEESVAPFAVVERESTLRRGG